MIKDRSATVDEIETVVQFARQFSNVTNMHADNLKDVQTAYSNSVTILSDVADSAEVSNIFGYISIKHLSSDAHSLMIKGLVKPEDISSHNIIQEFERADAVIVDGLASREGHGLQTLRALFNVMSQSTVPGQTVVYALPENEMMGEFCKRIGFKPAKHNGKIIAPKLMKL